MASPTSRGCTNDDPGRAISSPTYNVGSPAHHPSVLHYVYPCTRPLSLPSTVWYWNTLSTAWTIIIHSAQPRRRYSPTQMQGNSKVFSTIACAWYSRSRYGTSLYVCIVIRRTQSENLSLLICHFKNISERYKECGWILHPPPPLDISPMSNTYRRTTIRYTDGQGLFSLP